jgi:hypothetical protein
MATHLSDRQLVARMKAVLDPTSVSKIEYAGLPNAN